MTDGVERKRIDPCISLGDALATVFHHTPQVAHRTNTAGSSEACRSGIDLPDASAMKRLCVVTTTGTIGRSSAGVKTTGPQANDGYESR